MSKRILAAVLALIMVMSLDPYVFAGASAGETDLIQSFKATLFSGATLKSGEYVWSADGTDAHMFIYRVNFSLSGQGEFEPGSVSIRVPKTILKDRLGNYADIFDVSVPEENASGLNDSVQFVYETDGNDIIITNRLPIPAGWAGYFDIGYQMSESPFEYQDMAESDPFPASIEATLGDETDTDSKEAPGVCIDTYAYISSTKKDQGNNLCAREPAPGYNDFLCYHAPSDSRNVFSS